MPEDDAADSEFFHATSWPGREGTPLSNSNEARVSGKVVVQLARNVMIQLVTISIFSSRIFLPPCSLTEFDWQDVILLDCVQSNSVHCMLFHCHSPFMILDHHPVSPFVTHLLKLEWHSIKKTSARLSTLTYSKKIVSLSHGPSYSREIAEKWHFASPKLKNTDAVVWSPLLSSPRGYFILIASFGKIMELFVYSGALII